MSPSDEASSSSYAANAVANPEETSDWWSKQTNQDYMKDLNFFNSSADLVHQPQLQSLESLAIAAKLAGEIIGDWWPGPNQREEHQSLESICLAMAPRAKPEEEEHQSFAETRRRAKPDCLPNYSISPRAKPDEVTRPRAKPEMPIGWCLPTYRETHSATPPREKVERTRRLDEGWYTDGQGVGSNISPTKTFSSHRF